MLRNVVVFGAVFFGVGGRKKIFSLSKSFSL
jgi:hypothetical protein